MELCYTERMKKIISFDLDGTLVDIEFGNKVWNEGIGGKFAETYGVDRDLGEEWVRNAYAAIGDRNLLWYDIDYWLRRFNLPVSAAELLDTYAASIRLLPHVHDVLDTLAGKYELIIASNAARLFVEKELEQTGIASYFRRTVSATSDYGIVKKDVAFYQRLCSELGVSPEEMVHVGDHPIFDLEVPLQFGIDAFFVASQRPEPAGADNGRVLHDLRELIDRL
jgi:HAD superfamily hydrolase (TIGR01549 family)